MTEQITRYFDPVDKTLERLYKENILKKPRDELPLISSTVLLAPNGDYLWCGDTSHNETLMRLTTKQLLLPNGNVRPMSSEQYQSFYRDLQIIKVKYMPKPNNRLDYICSSPITQEQLKTIFKTQKDDPTLWITYDVVDVDKPFSYSGEGYRKMLEDLRKADYLPKE